MTGKEIRSAFLKYFQDHGHEEVSSSSLVPHDDPTLLFANAGMNQFKDTFLGKVQRPYVRATTCQKVVRAGGKHNDLENVGRTSRHHTFFEMLGNFSFGNYFKKEAISYAWDFLTRALYLPEDKLFVSIYNDDDEAFFLWRDMIGLDESRILRRGEKDNFWQMGDTGPCGPCSEIHIDQGPGTGCGRPDCNPDCECDRHLELWNLVFMQYNRDDNGTLHPLPKPSIDTGMGLERVTSVVQHVTSNYDTDLILPIIHRAAELASVKYGEDEAKNVSLRVLADHARAATFLISDGVLPSNEGRGYVLRRIMRRAMRHGHMLGISGAFFYKLCAFVIEFMKDHYVELTDRSAFVQKVVQAEEEAFSRTLTNGMKMVQEEVFDKLESGTEVAGELIFKLYDTHGFPLDLLTDVLEDAGYSLDTEGFEQFMARQQEKAKKAGLSAGTAAENELAKKLGSIYASSFNGYTSLEGTGTVLALMSNGAEVDSVTNDAEVILDRTPFYPEGGGQTGDRGVLIFATGSMEVNTTYKAGGAIIHKGRLISGVLKKGDSLTAKVDGGIRQATAKNHTATHLLHRALQEVLGEHARQAGSYVTPLGLRFDFSHFSVMESGQIRRVTELVNKAIEDDLTVGASIHKQEDAIKSGAMAFFGEKYGDEVRVIEVDGFSKELCGGTHVTNTAKIGPFVILSEASVAAGVRRIEALTGAEALKYLFERSKIVSELSQGLKSQPEELATRVADLQSNVKELNKELREIKEREQSAGVIEQMKAARNVNGISVVTLKCDELAMDGLRNMVDIGINRLKTKGVIMAASVFEGKVNLVCRLTADIVGEYKAGALIKEVAKIVGGSGGGRDDMAQAGGKDPSKVDEALEKVYSLI